MKTLKHTFFTLMLATAWFCAPALAEEAGAGGELPSVTPAEVPAMSQAAEIALPDPIFDELVPKGDRGPVVVTVAGIHFDEIGWAPLEPKYFIKLFHLLFGGKKLDEEAILKACAEYNKQFELFTEGGKYIPKMPPKRRPPENYMEVKLMALPEYAAGKLTVVPFQWTRDPGDTEKVVPGFVEKLAGVYDAYKGTGRPIYILAHSWGTVLMHETMHKLEKTRPDIRIDKFITVGSPLVPGNAVLKLFMTLEIIKEHLQKRVTKPAILGHWKNVWNGHDPYSNAIDAADENVQADERVEKVEPKLIDLFLHNAHLRDFAREDFFRVTDLGQWHSSYIYDFSASLKSLNKKIKVRVFKPIVAAEVLEKPHASD